MKSIFGILKYAIINTFRGSDSTKFRAPNEAKNGNLDLFLDFPKLVSRKI